LEGQTATPPALPTPVSAGSGSAGRSLLATSQPRIAAPRGWPPPSREKVRWEVVIVRVSLWHCPSPRHLAAQGRHGGPFYTGPTGHSYRPEGVRYSPHKQARTW